MRKRRILQMLLVLFAAAVVAFSCHDGDDNPLPSMTTYDRMFAVEASYGNYNEADMGKLADSLSANDSVNAFAQMMVNHHLSAQSELMSVMRGWPVDLPQGPDSMHVAMKLQLSGLQGMSFDTTYINGQIVDHEKAVTLYTNALDSLRHNGLRSYAASKLPIIRSHLDHARSIRVMLGQ